MGSGGFRPWAWQRARPGPSGGAAAATGDPADVVRYVADFLADHGGELQAGECIIAGAITPAVPVSSGDRIAVSLGPLGELTISFE